MRDVTIPLFDLLDLVNRAADFGFADDVFMASMRTFAGQVTDDEIREYAETFTTPKYREQGYDEEDRDAAIDTLAKWRDGYCDTAKTSSEGVTR